MAKETRTIFDLSDEEYADYEANPDNPVWQQVTDNSIEDANNMMFPDRDDDDDDNSASRWF